MDTLKILGLGASLALGACGLKSERPTEAPPVRVDVLVVGTAPTASGRTYSGTVAAGEGAELSFPIPGTVKAVHVKPGQTVGKGQLLAELNSESLENANNIAQATLAEARDTHARLKKLHDAHALADMKWVEVENALTAAENAAAMAARAVADARLYAPMAATVAARLVDEGQTVVPALPVVRLAALGDVKVEIPVAESEVGSLRVGQTAEITVAALGDEPLRGRLAEKAVEANPLTRTYAVKFAVDNPDGSLLPGMICRVTLPADTATGVVVPPQAVLLAADNRHFVWLARGGTARQRFVAVGDITAQGVVVDSGLAPGDSVITAGMQKVSSGMAVIPVSLAKQEGYGVWGKG